MALKVGVQTAFEDPALQKVGVTWPSCTAATDFETLLLYYKDRFWCHVRSAGFYIYTPGYVFAHSHLKTPPSYTLPAGSPCNIWYNL